MYRNATLTMLVSSTSMKVAIETMTAMIHGLTPAPAAFLPDEAALGLPCNAGRCCEEATAVMVDRRRSG